MREHTFKTKKCYVVHKVFSKVAIPKPALNLFASINFAEYEGACEKNSTE